LNVLKKNTKKGATLTANKKEISVISILASFNTISTDNNLVKKTPILITALDKNLSNDCR